MNVMYLRILKDKSDQVMHLRWYNVTLLQMLHLTYEARAPIRFFSFFQERVSSQEDFKCTIADINQVYVDIHRVSYTVHNTPLPMHNGVVIWAMSRLCDDEPVPYYISPLTYGEPTAHIPHIVRFLRVPSLPFRFSASERRRKFFNSIHFRRATI